MKIYNTLEKLGQHLAHGRICIEYRSIKINKPETFLCSPDSAAATYTSYLRGNGPDNHTDRWTNTQRNTLNHIANLCTVIRTHRRCHDRGRNSGAATISTQRSSKLPALQAPKRRLETQKLPKITVITVSVDHFRETTPKNSPIKVVNLLVTHHETPPRDRATQVRNQICTVGPIKTDCQCPCLVSWRIDESLVVANCTFECCTHEHLSNNIYIGHLGHLQHAQCRGTSHIALRPFVLPTTTATMFNLTQSTGIMIVKISPGIPCG